MRERLLLGRMAEEIDFRHPQQRLAAFRDRRRQDWPHWGAVSRPAPGKSSKLRSAGFTVAPGKNALRLGIASVQSRLEERTLRILKGRCPNLLAEAGLYRYDDSSKEGSENPLDEHNHALAALRYLISRLDARRMAAGLWGDRAGDTSEPGDATAVQRERSIAEMIDDESLWIPLG